MTFTFNNLALAYVFVGAAGMIIDGVNGVSDFDWTNNENGSVTLYYSETKTSKLYDLSLAVKAAFDANNHD